ncbi:MAG: hypothetical protein V9G19_18690 [Tetrasphaera sp.]
MPSYDVEIRDLHGQILAARYRLPAHNERVAVASARDYLPRLEADAVVTCFRRRRLRGRRLALTEYLAGGDGDGLAGVREPRRPLPGPGHLYAAADLPRPNPR